MYLLLHTNLYVSALYPCLSYLVSSLQLIGVHYIKSEKYMRNILVSLSMRELAVI